MQKGQLHDLTAIVERHHYALVGFLYRMTGGDRTLAQDLAQETFLRVIHAIQQYQYPRPFKPWLYMIATNIARDTFKRADTRRAADMPDDEHLLSDERPEEALVEVDEERRVAQALLKLPDHQREVVILRYYQELSLAEIAEALDIPVGTVKSRLSIGLDRLRETLED
jgi:RNA polymerase sigma-70 factor, ECF subfamily